MSDRTMFTPDRALVQSFEESQRKIRALSRRGTWAPSVGNAKRDEYVSGATAIQDFNAVGYPISPTEMLSLTLDPGRWVVVMELRAEAGAGGVPWEAGTIFTADTASHTVLSDLSTTGTLFFAHQAALEVKTTDTNVATKIEIYLGAEAGWTFSTYDFYEASIIAYPG